MTEVKELAEPATPGDPGRGFTLAEVLVVVVVIGLLLAIGASAFLPTGTSERRVARGEIQAMLTRARSHAIASGEPTAMVVIGLADGPDEMRGKALTLFEVKRDASGEGWEAGEQMRRWEYLPGSTILMDGTLAGGGNGKGRNFMDEESLLTVAVPSGGGGRKQDVEAAFVVFDVTGAVSHPSGSGRIEFHIGEGVWRSGSMTVTGKSASGGAITDRVVLSRLTGRAQSIASQQG
jgi:prepilin-type N-terminal cleavage/methylation domain-containing protein